MALPVVMLFALAGGGTASPDQPIAIQSQRLAAEERWAPVTHEQGPRREMRALIARKDFERLDLELVGLARFQGEPVCFLRRAESHRDWHYQTGDVIDGFDITAVTEEAVCFQRDGARFWLSLGEPSRPDALDVAHGAGSSKLPPHGATTTTETVETTEATQTLAALAARVAIRPEIEALTVPCLEAEDRLKTRTAAFQRAILIEDASHIDPGARVRRLFQRNLFIMPLEGRVTSGFGYRRHPIGGGRRFHNGVDLAAPHGTPVRAASSGTVSRAGYSYSLGRFVKIRHTQGYQTVYGHLARYQVRQGQRVDQGQVIGYEGSTGRSTGPHLHFEIRKNGKPVDPSSYLPIH